MILIHTRLSVIAYNWMYPYRLLMIRFSQAHFPDPSNLNKHQLSSASVSILGSNCCYVRCLASFNLFEIEGFQTSFKNRTHTDQQQFIFDAIAVTVSKTVCIKESNTSHHYLTLGGKRVCIAAFSRILGISRKIFNKVKELYSQGLTCATVRCYDRQKLIKFFTAVAWMDRYFNRIRD